MPGEVLLVSSRLWSSCRLSDEASADPTEARSAHKGKLLARYSTAQVAPFALIAPCTGTIGSWLVFGEVFGPLRYVGIVLILVGVAVTVLRRAGQLAPIRT